MASGLGFALRAGLVLWLADTLRLLEPHALGAPQALHAASLTAWFMLCMATALGLGLGLLWMGSPPSLGLAPREDTPSAHVEAIARTLALAGSCALFVALGYPIAKALVTHIVRSYFAALALCATHLVLALFCVASFDALRQHASRAVRALSRRPVTGWVLGSLWRFLLAAGALAAAALGALSLLFWEVLRYLPWRPLLAGSAALVVAGTWTWLRRRARPSGRVRALAALGWLAAVALTSHAALGTHRAVTRYVSQQTIVGSAGFGVLRAAFDRDGDGHLHVMAGGDCRPDDPSIHPGAVEVPLNGVDEDCSGRDLSIDQLVLHGRADYPLDRQVPKNPPIFLITVDAFAAHRLRALGGTRDTTPQLDGWLEHAALFERCFSQGPSTRLSFPSMFASRYDSEIAREVRGRLPYPIQAGQPLLASMLARRGYDTTAVVPVGYFLPRRWKGLTRGFERVEYAPRGRPAAKHTSHYVTDTVLRQLKRLKKRKRPHFMWVHYFDTHAPHRQPEEAPVYGTRDEDIYDAELRFVDKQLGRLLSRIDRQYEGQALVFITGDHGWAADAPRHTKKHYGYDLHTTSLHVPLLVRAPFVRPGRRDVMVSTMDITPTIVNLLGLKQEGTFRGSSLVPELLHNRERRPALLVHQFFLTERIPEGNDPLQQIALRTPRFNLIHNRKLGTYELYDWRRDYLEKYDLFDDPALLTERRALKEQLDLITYKLHHHNLKTALAP